MRKFLQPIKNKATNGKMRGRKFFASVKRRWKTAVVAISTLLYITLPQAAYASGGIGGSSFAKGFQKLLDDLTKWLIIIAPIVTGVLLIYFFIRRGASDEHEQSVATRCCQ